MNDVYLLSAIIALLAVVQSIFGMGILVFGTPTLLLIGFDFTTVLGLLLPSSMAKLPVSSEIVCVGPP